MTCSKPEMAGVFLDLPSPMASHDIARANRFVRPVGTRAQSIIAPGRPASNAATLALPGRGPVPAVVYATSLAQGHDAHGSP